MLKSLRAFARREFTQTATSGRSAALAIVVVGSLPVQFGSVADEPGARPKT